MVIPDANLLLYTVNTIGPDYPRASKWWTDLIHSRQPIGLYSGVISAFLRLSTKRGIFNTPLTVLEAFEYLDNWMSFPETQILETTPQDLATTKSLLSELNVGGNLVNDAQIAAVAIRLKATLHSADSDFGRFTGLKWHNPLA